MVFPLQFSPPNFPDDRLLYLLCNGCKASRGTFLSIDFSHASVTAFRVTKAYPKGIEYHMAMNCLRSVKRMDEYPVQFRRNLLVDEWLGLGRAPEATSRLRPGELSPLCVVTRLLS